MVVECLEGKVEAEALMSWSQSLLSSSHHHIGNLNQGLSSPPRVSLKTQEPELL